MNSPRYSQAATRSQATASRRTARVTGDLPATSTGEPEILLQAGLADLPDDPVDHVVVEVERLVGDDGDREQRHAEHEHDLAQAGVEERRDRQTDEEVEDRAARLADRGEEPVAAIDSPLEAVVVVHP